MYSVTIVPLVRFEPASGLVFTTLPAGILGSLTSFCSSLTSKPSSFNLAIASFVVKPETSGMLLCFFSNTPGNKKIAVVTITIRPTNIAAKKINILFSFLTSSSLISLISTVPVS